jgi:4-aminobutyrate aminotransferase-like enzyme
VIDEEGLLERAMAIGSTIRTRCADLQASNPAIGDIRGPGAMIGVEFVDADGAPAPDVATRVVRESMERGLILLKAGVEGNVIRTLVPLVITDEQLDEALDVLEEAIVAATSTAAVPA